MFSGTHITTNTGRLYTDTRGRVVFADQGFADLFRGVTPANPIGRPLHEVLGIEPSAAHVLLNVHGEEQRDLLLRKPGMPPGASVLCTCRAATNAFGKVFGANLLFSRTTGASRAIQYQPDRARLESYFTEQLDTLQVLVGRVGGPALRQTLENAFNRTAAQSAWPVQLKNGLLEYEQRIDLGPIYSDLLAEAMNYAISVAGQPLVTAEMQRVHQEVDDRTRQLAEHFGLHDLFFGKN